MPILDRLSRGTAELEADGRQILPSGAVSVYFDSVHETSGRRRGIEVSGPDHGALCQGVAMPTETSATAAHQRCGSPVRGLPQVQLPSVWPCFITRAQEVQRTQTGPRRCAVNIPEPNEPRKSSV